MPEGRPLGGQLHLSGGRGEEGAGYLYSYFIFNRPGVAGAVLQSALSLTDSLTH